jgi:hypothetical protein
VGRMTFQKRQKEMKRQEKQQRKAERRAERKLAKNAEDKNASQSSESVAPIEQESAT